ncbi:MAG TPA: TolC family protein [Vicinamibacterales bacterium]|nr:TolC family protein [Vicinamibacterales bacterium]
MKSALLLTATLLLSSAGLAFAQIRPSLPSTSPFMGGVPSGQVTPGTMPLSITDAISRALQHNLGLLLADNAETRAKGARWDALSALLPNLSGKLSETRQKINLAAYGFPLPDGIPPVVGPFNVFDARVYLSQAVLDFKALNDTRAQRHNEAAAGYSYKSARDLVVLVSANAYLEGLAAQARAASARAELETAEALNRQAVDLKAGGLVAGIDVLRAQVQLSTAQQRATASANDFDKSKLQLAVIIGLPPGQEFSLSDEIPFVPVPDMTVDEALDRAYKARPDFQAANERVKAAEAARQAVIGEALPSVRINADYGALGLTPGTSVGTFSLAGALNVPIFQGGKTQGKLMEANADLRSRTNERDDLKAQIYYDVRSALLDLKASSEQFDVASKGRDLAGQQLAQARDRFAAGVADNIEVVQAQQAVAVSNEQYISGLYGFNVAKALLARNLGVAEDAIRQFLGGTR